MDGGDLVLVLSLYACHGICYMPSNEAGTYVYGCDTPRIKDAYTAVRVLSVKAGDHHWQHCWFCVH
jgi:hypothetical protein